MFGEHKRRCGVAIVFVRVSSRPKVRGSRIADDAEIVLRTVSFTALCSFVCPRV
jgi:hypothetical protein